MYLNNMIVVTSSYSVMFGDDAEIKLSFKSDGGRLQMKWLE